MRARHSTHREIPSESALKTPQKNDRTQLQLLIDGNILTIVGPLGMGNYCRVLAAIHDRVSERGYQKIKLDFSRCDAAFAGPMLALCAQVETLRTEGAE